MRQFEDYAPRSQQAMTCAREIARQFQHRMIGPEHLLLGIIKTGDAFLEALFSNLQVDTTRLSQALAFVIGRGNNRNRSSEPIWNAMAQTAFTYAEHEAVHAGALQVDLVHLLLGLLNDDESTAVGVLESFDVTLFAVRWYLRSFSIVRCETARSFSPQQIGYAETPLLNQVSRDLTCEAQRGMLDPLVGRVSELETIMQVLARKTKKNPLLVGPAGVGKTALVEGLAQRIVQGQVLEDLQQTRIVSLDVSLLSIGMHLRGDFEKQMKSILQEIEHAGNVIVVTDELQTLLEDGVTEGSMSLANIVKPVLARGGFRCIGAVTFDHYRRILARDPALERRFRPVIVAETSSEETLDILNSLRAYYASYHRVTIADDALTAALHLSNRYMHQRFQPDKALDLLDEASARASMQVAMTWEPLQKAADYSWRRKEGAIRQDDYPQALRWRKREQHFRQKLRELEGRRRSLSTEEQPVVTAQQIAEVVALRTGIPCGQITKRRAERLLHLEAELHQRVIGQDEAVHAVARAVRRAHAGISDRNRPRGSFLFVGPPGVGKSELARALACTLFGDEKALLTLDMSEFMERHHIARLVGSPPGYIGYGDGGELTEFVRRQPYSVLLFDEIEKAHPDACNLLLQIFEDGCLTDARGCVVDFKQTLIILTSNLGTEYAHRGMAAFTSASQMAQASFVAMREQALSAVKRFFRPELFQRLDELVFFSPLEAAHLQQIADLFIAGTRQRLARKSIGLQVTDAARALLIRQGYEPACGARTLRRVIQNCLDDLLTRAVLQGLLSPQDETIVDVDGDQLVLRTMPSSVSVQAATGQRLLS